MSASFPAPVSGHFAQPSPMYPNQGFGVYNDPYQQLYNQAPGSSYPAPSHQPGSQQPVMKPSFDPRQANGYVYPQNGAGQMMSPGMGGPYPQQSMRPPQNYYGQQQAMGQMPPASMQKPPASSASSTAMGPPNGMQQNMMIQQGMNHIPTSAAGPAGQIPTQMKSPMSMPIRPQQQQSTQPQMNSPGMFAAPAPPRMKQQLPSPGTMHVMPSHPMAGDPSSSTASHMVQQAQNPMNPSTPRSLPAPPTQETPFTAVTHYEMPPAFPQYQDQFKKHNPTTVHYYDRRRSQLKLNYPTGQVQAPAQEPPTFGFLPGQARYEEKFDRRNPASSIVPTTQMNSAPMTSNPMLHRQMSAPGIASPSYAQQQQQMMPAPTGPAAKKTKRSASTTVEPNPPPSYQANRMVHMGTFNNPNLKSPGLMPMNSPMGSMQSPQMPPSSVAGSNGMNMMPGMPPIGANGMNGNGMVPSSIGMDHNGMGSHVGNGMAQSMSNMQQNGQFHDMRPPPQYSQMQMPSSSQVYNNQMQQRYGNGLMSPAHQEPNPSPMQQNGSQPGMLQPQEQISQQHPQQLMYMRQLPPCNTCKAEITQGSPCKICANPSCRRTFHVKCSGLTDAATSLLNQNADIGWVCPVCDPRPR